MIFLNNIVENINTHLKTKVFNDDVFFNSNVVGLTDVIPFEIDDTTVYIPAVINENGDADIITVDDSYSLQIYHRVSTKNVLQVKSQYGQSDIIQSDTYNMHLILIGNRNKLQTNQFKLEQKLSKSLPSEDAITKSSILILNVDFNSKRIFESEFQNVGYKDLYDFFYFKLIIKLRHQNTKLIV